MVKGFIVDVPRALIRSGKQSYYATSLSTGNIQLQGSSIDIKGGQSLFDLINIPSGVSITITMADTMLNGDMIDLGMGAERTEDIPVAEQHFGYPFEVDETDYTITIDGEIEEDSLHINGFTETSSAIVETDEYNVEVDTSAHTTTVTFDSSMAGKEVFPSYSVIVEGGERHDILTTSVPKKGSVVLQFPVYSNDSDDAAISHTCQITVFKASINQNMTIGGSYKTAQTYELSIKGLDPQRPDKRMFSVEFIPYKSA